uniref:Uncharacterized protein n=1 Tax=Brassica oleracea TaxID=3712 RepID=A0A3P6D6Q6_BRAOL|nr:unnamed protein product [Brassica oleracea]
MIITTQNFYFVLWCSREVVAAESIVKVGFLGFARGFRISWFGLSSCDGGAWRRMFQLVLKIRCAVFQIFFLPETGERLSDSGLSTYPRRLGVSHPFSGDRRASEVPLPRGVWFLLSALACCEGWWWSHVDVLRLSMASPVQLCRVSLSSVSSSSWFRGQCSG